MALPLLPHRIFHQYTNTHWFSLTATAAAADTAVFLLHSLRVNLALHATETQTIKQPTVQPYAATHSHTQNNTTNTDATNVVELQNARVNRNSIGAFSLSSFATSDARTKRKISYDCIAWNYKYSIKRVETKVHFWIWRRRPYALYSWFKKRSKKKNIHNIYFSSFFHDFLSHAHMYW